MHLFFVRKISTKRKKMQFHHHILQFTFNKEKSGNSSEIFLFILNIVLFLFPSYFTVSRFFYVYPKYPRSFLIGCLLELDSSYWFIPSRSSARFISALPLCSKILLFSQYDEGLLKRAASLQVNSWIASVLFSHLDIILA